MTNTGLDPSDFYLDEFGNMVFTASFHKKRGFCCQSGCRHCPYDLSEKVSVDTPIELSLGAKECSLSDLADLYLKEYEEDKKS